MEDAPKKQSMQHPGTRLVALTIAGFDPSSGAGITADLKVFAAQGLYGAACITALTVQSTLGVRAIEAVSPAHVQATLDILAEDFAFSGIKLGMLATGEICSVVAAFLESLPDVPVVLDPVLRSSSGKALLDADGLRLIQERLLQRVNWITPNLDELSVLTGLKVVEASRIPKAAEKLQTIARSAGNDSLQVLVTGGHLEVPDDFLLTSTGELFAFPGVRVATSSTHGTGCALSSALLCALVKGSSPVEAARAAKGYVTEALRHAYPVGSGKGPVNHFFLQDSRERGE